MAAFNGRVYGNPDLSWDVIAGPTGSNARILENQNLAAHFDTDIAGSYVVRWNFRENGREYSDYSIIHAYWPQGAIIFGPQALNDSRSLDKSRLCPGIWSSLTLSLFFGCSDLSWDFSITDLTKNYALVMEYDSVESGFVHLNEKKLFARYDFLTTRSLFAKQIDVLLDNTIELSFSEGSDVTFKVQEMAFSGMEDDPPALAASTIEVVQGEVATGQVTVTDSGSTEHHYSILEQATYGEAVINESGEITYTANADYEGSDLIIIKVDNSNDLSQLLRILINVSSQSSRKGN